MYGQLVSIGNFTTAYNITATALNTWAVPAGCPLPVSPDLTAMTAIKAAWCVRARSTSS